MSKIPNGGLTRSSGNRMLYSCTRLATVGVKGLTSCRSIEQRQRANSFCLVFQIPECRKLSRWVLHPLNYRNTITSPKLECLDCRLVKTKCVTFAIE